MRPRRQPSDPYATLGLAPGASRADVRRAYRQRAMAIHPDTSGSESTAEMARLNRARDELLARSAAPGGQPGGDEPSPGRPAQPPARPAWAEPYEAAWTNYWSAWNELPRRDGGQAADPDDPSDDHAERDRHPT